MFNVSFWCKEVSFLDDSVFHGLYEILNRMDEPVDLLVVELQFLKFNWFV